jgi:GAF domain-containing protein
MTEVSPVDPRAKALSALARFQVTEASVGETLHQIAEITLEAVPRAEVVGMSLLGGDGRPTTAVYTDEDSPEIDAAQYRDGKGPCLDAWRLATTVRLDRVKDAADEYPGFAAACRAHGMLSTLSLPIVHGDGASGAVNLYARTEDAFSAEDEVLARELAAAAGTVMANVSAYWTALELGQQLTEAMQSRAVIEQAKGMLMARDRALSADGAFDMLRKASQRENVKLRDVAQRIVERQPLPPGSEG